MYTPLGTGSELCAAFNRLPEREPKPLDGLNPAHAGGQSRAEQASSGSFVGESSHELSVDGLGGQAA